MNLYTLYQREVYWIDFTFISHPFFLLVSPDLETLKVFSSGTLSSSCDFTLNAQSTFGTFPFLSREFCFFYPFHLSLVSHTLF